MSLAFEVVGTALFGLGVLAITLGLILLSARRSKWTEERAIDRGYEPGRLSFTATHERWGHRMRSLLLTGAGLVVIGGLIMEIVRPGGR